MSQTPQNFPNPSLVPIASIVEAMSWANGVGVSHIDYDGDLRIARIVTAALKDINQAGLRMPDVIQANREAFFSEFGDDAIDSPAGTLRSVLLLNPDASYWDTPAEDAKDMFDGEFWSTDHALHPIYHEAGHFAHYRRDGDPVARWRRRRFNAKNQHLANRVSRYARFNVAECIAEVMAKLLADESVEPDILTWYRKQGGIVP